MIFKDLTINYPPIYTYDFDYEIEEKILNDRHLLVKKFTVGLQAYEFFKKSIYFIGRGKYCSDGRDGTYDKRPVYVKDYVLPSVIEAEGEHLMRMFRVIDNG